MFLTLSSVVSTFGNLARFQAELFPVSEYHIDVVVFSVPLIEVETGWNGGFRRDKIDRFTCLDYWKIAKSNENNFVELLEIKKKYNSDVTSSAIENVICQIF
jgi:hypothetical protein